MTEPEKIPVLLVDDRPENLVALEGLLEDMGLAIYKAGSGNEALGLSLKHDFAIVLMDVRMPEMDG
ncbi:MAG: response regulator, partial [Nitrospirae bacterium]|nr:response regulator [Nitrospirota bacterium]MBI5848835.1 response regulator [Nitrospirota bacterium]